MQRLAAGEDDVVAGLGVLLEGGDDLVGDLVVDGQLLAALALPGRDQELQQLMAVALDADGYRGDAGARAARGGAGAKRTAQTLGSMP